MSAFLEGIGKILGKLSDHVQGRTERLKNEKQRLLDERHILLRGTPTLGSINRVRDINVRLSQIDTILGNKAAD